MGALELHPCCILHLILGGHTEVLECLLVYQKGPFVPLSGLSSQADPH